MISGCAASSPPVSDPKAGRISLVAEATKQRRETLPALELQPELGMEMAGDFRAAGRRAPLRGEGRCRRLPTSSASRPPQWSAKPGSWLPTIHTQSSRRGHRVSNSRAAAGSRSQPKRSWKLSPRQ